MTTGATRRVAVYRQAFLNRSETFVRDHMLNLRRWQPTALSSWRAPDPLEVPGVPLVVAGEGSVGERLRRRVPQRLLSAPAEHQQDLLRKALRRLRPDVVHAHFGTDAAVVVRAAAELDIPLVVTWHGYEATQYDDFLRRSEAGRLLLERRADVLSGAAGTIPVSRFIASELARKGGDEARMDVIPCGVDTREVTWTPPPPDGCLLFVGRLVEKKGLGDLLEALAGLTNPPRLQVIGSGPLREPWERQAAEAGLDVEWLGTRTSAQVREAMRSAAAVALPSRRAANGDCEGLPVVSLEAGASGRPVIGYAHSGLVDSVLDGTTGFLAPEGDVSALATSVEKVFSDADLREGLGLAGRDHVVANFDIRATTGRIEALYERVS